MYLKGYLEEDIPRYGYKALHHSRIVVYILLQNLDRGIWIDRHVQKFRLGIPLMLIYIVW